MIGRNGNPRLDQILLVDSSCDLKNLKNIKSYKKIITFDYETHKFLSNNKIAHDVSEVVLKIRDLEKIEKHSYKFMKWFEQPKIFDLLNYKNVNLGQIIVVEFHHFLISFLKTYIELLRILEIYGDVNYFCSTNLSEIMKHITKNIIIVDEKSHYENRFIYDTILYDFRVWKFSHSFKLSQNSFTKLKNLSEIISQKLISKNHLDKNHKMTLLLNFDLIRYRKLFHKLNEAPLNIIVFNRRKPAVWNFKSFLIARKSKCIIENNFTLNDDSTIKSIDEGFNKIKEKIINFKLHESFFKSFFSLDQKSLWPLIKNQLLNLAEKRFKEAVREIEFADKLLEKYKINSILIHSESSFHERIILSLAQARNIPVILIQHGVGYDTVELPDGVKYLGGGIPNNSFKMISWGLITKQYLKKIGISENKIKILGSPIHDQLFEKSYQREKRGNYILLTTSSPTKWITSDLKIETKQKYELAIQKICEVCLQLNKKLVVKLHPDQDEMDITNLIKKINKKISVLKFADTLELIQNCDLMVTIDMSTVILEAQILKKAVIVVPVKKYEWGIPEVYRSKSCLISEADNIENALKHLDNEVFRNNLIQKGTDFANQYLINDGKATERLLEFLQE